MARIKVRPFGESLKEALRDPRDAAAYLNAAFEEGEEGFLLALRDVAEAHGVSSVALKAGVGRESLYKTLSKDGNPKLGTLLKLLHAMGVRLSFEPDAPRRMATG